MSPHASIQPRRLVAMFSVLVCFACPATGAAATRVSENYGKLPLHFEANRGQTHGDVRFLSRGPGYSLYLTAGEAVLVLSSSSAETQAAPVALRMALVGANREPLVAGLGELPGKANYFIGSDPAQWRTNVPTFGKVHYRDVYPGIDLVYHGNQRQLEYDFVIAPGADPEKIVLGFNGADKLEIDTEGNLVLHAAGGEIRQHKPIVYQDVAGIRMQIDGRYVRRGANRIGFEVGAYDEHRPLIIDPVLAYATYLGGSENENGSGIAVDNAGNAYVTGRARSTNFPTTSGAPQPANRGGQFDVFVTKLNPAGTGLVYSTYLGGSSEDYGEGIAVDADGNAYAAGHTDSTDFPVTPGAFQTANSRDCSRGCIGTAAFVTKLDPSGAVVVYSTYLGGRQWGGAGSGIAVDALGNAYLTGRAGADFPTTAGAFDTTSDGGADSFVSKLTAAGSGLVYSTFLGGSNHDVSQGIAVDADGNAYVTGYTASIDFPTTPGAFQPIFAVGQQTEAPTDAFLAKLNPVGSALVFSTYLGGNSQDIGYGIAVDAEANAYVTGSTYSTDFPVTRGAFQTNSAGGGDAFATKLHATGSVLVYSTYLSGSGDETGRGIALDASRHAYVSGNTASVDYPTTSGAIQSVSAGGFDAFVTKLNPAGSALVDSTYLGGSGQEFGSRIAVDAGSNRYVTGSTSSFDFPTTSGAFQRDSAGDYDAFIAKIEDVQAPPPNTTRFEEHTVTYTGHWTMYGEEAGVFSGGTVRASPQSSATATFSFAGTAITWIGVKCDVCGIAIVSIDGGAPTTVNTVGPGTWASFTSEPVFSASGLAPDVIHTIVITVTGTTTVLRSLLVGGTHVAVDAFDVTR